MLSCRRFGGTTWFLHDGTDQTPGTQIGSVDYPGNAPAMPYHAHVRDKGASMWRDCGTHRTLRAAWEAIEAAYAG